MKKIFLTTIAAAALTMTSCDSYMDINVDPTTPSADGLTTSLMLPTVEMNLAASYGNFMRITGGYYAQQYAQQFGTSNYVDFSRFSMSATRSSSLAYSQVYLRVISNAQGVIEKAKAANEPGTILAATTLKAFAYATLVDNYGETPYTEALKSDIMQPKFDDGRTVYDGIIAELDEAIKGTSAGNTVATNFLFPNANATNWIRFAKALKLKLLSRISNVDNSVLPQIKALIDENDFPTADVAWAGCWSSTAGSESPFYAEEFATNWGSTQTNVVANLALVGTMQQGDYVDPRLGAFFEVNDEGVYAGSISGNNLTGSSYSDKSFSRPVASYDMPVYLITVSEIDFFKSEYYARSNDATNAAKAYADAIAASFATAGVTGADACVEKFPYDQANWKKCIGVAKWIALSGTNNHEAWCELRRLRYPEFNTSATAATYYSNGTIDASSYKPGTLYTPLQVDNLIGTNKLLERWPYAEAATSANTNAPKQDNTLYTTPVFWAK